MNSFKFNSKNMANYGLGVIKSSISLEQSADAVQLDRRAWAHDSKVSPAKIDLSVVIQASSRATLLSYLDSIRRFLGDQQDASLELDSYSDRYWMARFQSINGEFQSPIAWMGDISFICYDPYAYSNIEYAYTYSIDDDPDTVDENTGGNALIEPVFTLTAIGNQPDITVVLRNDNTGEEIEWNGDLADGDVLVIDSSLWLVTLNDTPSMLTVDGKFPTLVPATTNLILISGFIGNLNISYRNRYK